MARKENVERGDVGKRFLFSANGYASPRPFAGVVVEISPSGDYFGTDDGMWYSVRGAVILEELPPHPIATLQG